MYNILKINPDGDFNTSKKEQANKVKDIRRVTNKSLIYSSYNGVKIYRLKSKNFNFELEQSLEYGDLMTLKTSDNAKLTKILVNTGISPDRLKALGLINHGFIV